MIFLLVMFWVLLISITHKFTPVVDDVGRPTGNSYPKTVNQWVQYLRGSTKFNPSITFEHCTNWLLHAIVACLVYIKFGPTCAVVWCAHPCAIPVHTWFNGRRYAIAAMIALAISIWPYGAVIWPYAFIWQWSAVPAIVFSHAPWWVYVLGCLVATRTWWYGYKWYHSRKTEVGTTSPLNIWSLKRLTYSVKLFGRYFFHCALPLKVAHFYPWYDYFGMNKKNTDEVFAWDTDAWRGVLAILICAAGVWYAPTRYGTLWFCVFISIFLHTFNQPTIAFTDRYLYIASMGLMSLVPMPYAYIVAGYYLAMTVDALRQYRNFRYFFDYNCTVFPECTRAYQQYVANLILNKRHNEAITFATIGLHYRPDDYALNLMMGRLHMDIKMWGAAKQYLHRAYLNPIMDRVAAEQVMLRGMIAECCQNDKKEKV